MQVTSLLLAATASVAAAADIQFKYFFGSRCPGCIDFGAGDFVKLYGDFGSDDSISWLINPAVRDPAGACIEEADCSWEAVTLCGFNQTETADRVKFLSCLDGQPSGSSDRTQAALNAGKKCAPDANVNVATLSTCYNGDQATELLQEASAIWDKQFPSRATVPHTFVGADDVQPDYDDLKSALCKAGSTASVCKKSETKTTIDVCYA